MMPRNVSHYQTIAILTTGDELSAGEILNTNGQYIAEKISDLGLEVGMHITTRDDDQEIIDAIQFLLSRHDILIITGGLGPTSDDRTRFALGQALSRALVFDDESWQRIVNRLKRYRLNIAESNKQQALFPDGAKIIPNENGTASGCMIEHDTKLVFMLPGPPPECRPMLSQFVLPEITKRQDSEQRAILLRWRLFGVSEGEIASYLDQLLANYPCTTGYRWDYPYLEFKIKTKTQAIIEELQTLVDEAIAKHLICTPELTATELLCQAIANFPGHMYINDAATAGLLEHKLAVPNTIAKLSFHQTNPVLKQNDVKVQINGLDEFWQLQPSQGLTHLDIRIETLATQTQHHLEIPFRSRAVTQYAVEFISFQILKFLQENKLSNI